MPIALGSTNISKAYLGSTALSQLYLGGVPLLATVSQGRFWRIENVSLAGQGAGDQTWNIAELTFMNDGVAVPEENPGAGPYDLVNVWNSPNLIFDGNDGTVGWSQTKPTAPGTHGVGLEWPADKLINGVRLFHAPAINNKSIKQWVVNAGDNGVNYTQRGAMYDMVDDAAGNNPRIVSVDPYDDPVKGVLERYQNLIQNEIDAITEFVDGCVADGVWSRIIDFWCFALGTEADALKGMRQHSLVYGQSGSPGSTPGHKPREGYYLPATSSGDFGYLQTVATMDDILGSSFRAGGGIYVSSVSQDAASSSSHTYFGGRSAGGGSNQRLYMHATSSRHRYRCLTDKFFQYTSAVGTLEGDVTQVYTLGEPDTNLKCRLAHGPTVYEHTNSSDFWAHVNELDLSSASGIAVGCEIQNGSPTDPMRDMDYTPGAFFLTAFGDQQDNTMALALRGRVNRLMERTKALVFYDFTKMTELPADVVFTSAGGGSYRDANGDIQVAGVNEPRFDHAAGTLEPLGLLIEATYSEVCYQLASTIPGYPGLDQPVSLYAYCSQNTLGTGYDNIINSQDINDSQQRIGIQITNVNVQQSVNTGGGTNRWIAGNTISAGQLFKVAHAAQDQDIQLVSDGAAKGSQTNTNMMPNVAPNRLTFGASQTHSQLNGHLREAALYDRRLSQAEMEALTTL